ncbi:OXA-48 family carbapenem-hydrolyzing class D beta-lactamase OXA-54 [Ignavibacteriales bacterium]
MPKRYCLILFLTLFVITTLSAQTQSELQKFFDEGGFKGSITIYDKKADKWIFSDSTDAHLELLPASSSKIFNSLVFLEEGVLKDENEMVKWDGIKRWVDDWNQDLDLRRAFKFSAAWVYCKLAPKVGREKYLDYLDKCNYGNKFVGAHVDSFWLDGSLRISPVQQVNFLRNLDAEKLPFSKRTFSIVKNIMIEKENSNHTLRAKTGWGKIAGQDDTGWWVGYLTRKDNVIYFATRLRKGYYDENPQFSSSRKNITANILKHLGYGEIF